jgi:hypothetical protein
VLGKEFARALPDRRLHVHANLGADRGSANARFNAEVRVYVRGAAPTSRSWRLATAARLGTNKSQIYVTPHELGN